MEILTVLAIIIGPIAAVQIQKLLERRRERKQNKLNIFKTLMATRANRLNYRHVEALNMIDIEFDTEDESSKGILDTWKTYLDHLENYPSETEESDKISRETIWSDKSEELLIDLLFEMAKYFDYKFDKIKLKRGIYAPKGHVEIEAEQILIRKALVEILSGKKPIPVQVLPT